MKITRQFEWRTHLGNVVSIEGIEDTHLANAIQFCFFYERPIEILLELHREAKRRNLSKEFLDKAQYPYKDGKGNWIVWDFKTHKPKTIGRYA